MKKRDPRPTAKQVRTCFEAGLATVRIQCALNFAANSLRFRPLASRFLDDANAAAENLVSLLEPRSKKLHDWSEEAVAVTTARRIIKGVASLKEALPNETEDRLARDMEYLKVDGQIIDEKIARSCEFRFRPFAKRGHP